MNDNTTPADEADVLHAEHHPGTVVPSLDTCPDHTRAEYEALALALAGRPDAPTPTPAGRVPRTCTACGTPEGAAHHDSRDHTGYAWQINRPAPTPAGDDQGEALEPCRESILAAGWDPILCDEPRGHAGRHFAARPSAPTVTTEQIDQAAQAAFLSDDLGGHIRGPHSWDTIPEMGRENYRRLVRAILATLLIEVTP